MASDNETWQKSANGSADLKYNIEIDNEETMDHLR